MKKLMVCTVLTMLLLTGCQDEIKEGTKQLEERQYTEAVGYFEKALEKKKNVTEAYRGLGMAYYEQQDYQSAKEAFQQVLSNNGEATPVLYNLLGVCSIHLEDYQGALDAFSQGLALAAGKRDTDEGGAGTVQEMKFNEIVCYERLLDWESAKEKAAEYISTYPDDKEAQKEAAFLSTR